MCLSILIISSVTASGMISIQTGGWLHGNKSPRPIVAFHSYGDTRSEVELATS
jgi:hypothetical protein